MNHPEFSVRTNKCLIVNTLRNESLVISFGWSVAQPTTQNRQHIDNQSLIIFCTGMLFQIQKFGMIHDILSEIKFSVFCNLAILRITTHQNKMS